MENYRVSIVKASKELSKVEKVKFKDTSDCVKIDEITKNEDAIIDVDFFVLLDVHNEVAKGEKDYRQIVIVDTTGTKFVTGSKTFVQNFLSIAEELDGEEYAIKAIRKPSKNYAGKEFLTCVIA